MSKQRTAQGKIIDMTALASKYERARAVGNMNVNARGDTIDSYGKILVPVTQKVGKAYGKTVGNKSANAPVAPPPQQQNPVAAFEMSKEEKELESMQDDDHLVEEIKAKENNSK